MDSGQSIKSGFEILKFVVKVSKPISKACMLPAICKQLSLLPQVIFGNFCLF